MATKFAEMSDKLCHLWRPSRCEWNAYVQSNLDALGVTYEELERQAADRAFESTEAMNLWAIIGA